VACDSYHRFEDDIALMREMNLTSYRFSFAWPRIQPTGSGATNAKGIDYYNALIDALLAAGIRPIPTLYHWDLPQTLEDAGGWPARDTAGRFADYAEVMMRAFGDRVSDWLIFNEPAIFTVMGYLAGIHAPGRRDREAFLRASHTVNLAQGEAFRAMRAARSDARIGSAFSMAHCEPLGDSQADLDATERFHAFMNTWFLEPALRGRYPDAYVEGVPTEAMGVQEGDLEKVKAPLDFLGINLYSRALVAASPGDPSGLDARAAGPMGGNDGPKTDFGWEVWPNALHDMVLRITRDYDRPVIEITENGCSYADAPDANGRIRDERRIAFYRGYLSALARAIEAGADVRGYHAWTLLDNFEWAEGYEQRFGLAWLDFPETDRTLKDSGRWYGEVASDNGFEE
jgi:beta-glucosidase